MTGRQFAAGAGVSVAMLSLTVLLESATPRSSAVQSRAAVALPAQEAPTTTPPATSAPAPPLPREAPLERSGVPAPTVTFVRPRGNAPPDTPLTYGFWSFAAPVPGVLSRSGQPLFSEFAWLKNHGWKGVVNLRVDGERGGEVGDDARLPGFSTLGFAHLHLPLTEGYPPSDQQAEEFLRFVTNPAHQPVHIHCRGGIGRTSTMVALYRYAVQGWPIEDAIFESRGFLGGMTAVQAGWLRQWARTHPPASNAASEAPAG